MRKLNRCLALAVVCWVSFSTSGICQEDRSYFEFHPAMNPADWKVKKGLGMVYVPSGSVEMTLEVDENGRPIAANGTFVAKLSGFWIGVDEFPANIVPCLMMQEKLVEYLKGSILPEEAIRLERALQVNQQPLLRSGDLLNRYRHYVPPAAGWNRQQVRRMSHILSMLTGKFYRLPTQAEWEYACRAGAKTKYPWGKNSSDLESYAVSFREPENDPNIVVPSDAQPNRWGIYDMLGSVEEYVADGYCRKLPYAPGSTVSDPIIWPFDRGSNPLRMYPNMRVSTGCLTKGGAFWKERFPSHDDFLPECRKNFGRDETSAFSQVYEEYNLGIDIDYWRGVGFRFVRPVKIPSREEQLWHWGIIDNYDKWQEFTFEPSPANENVNPAKDK